MQPESWARSPTGAEFSSSIGIVVGVLMSNALELPSIGVPDSELVLVVFTRLGAMATVRKILGVSAGAPGLAHQL
jgi:hypothetical protein